ncbi:hypothetical protein SOM61_15810 [Massilia sp. CFBP9012]|nr:hypothetical protein [Massilia sp. CFBP9012]
MAACIGLGLITLMREGEAVPEAPQAPPAAPIAAARTVTAPPENRAARRRQLVEQVRLTDHTYCSYLAHSRYPHESRPAGHHPDQLYPNQPLLETNPMRAEGGDSHPEVQLQTAQSRVYLAAGEQADFSLRALDGGGQPQPLVVTRALAQGMTYGQSRPAPQVAVPFADEGAAWRGTLAPAQTALAGFHGTIRLEVRYQAGGREGVVLFDVIYSPQSPASWSGRPREAVDGGALQFALPLDVRLPGRYVVTGRVDDAAGRPFALATFNEVLGQGAQQVRLQVHGKLLHDGAPRLPLLLRDVEGYLLRENLDPDRLLLPRLEGKVFASRTRSLDGVPDTEWQSEERSRYLAEYAKDRAAARTRLARFDPQAAMPPADCGIGRMDQ